LGSRGWPSTLLSEYDTGGAPIVAAQRLKRSEGVTFRVFYVAFKQLYRLLTGHHLAFGNFAVISGEVLPVLVRRPELWSNFPATILRSRLPISRVLTNRGQRYSGESKMSFAALVLHGLTAISVFGDVALVRVLLFSSIIGLGAFAAILVVVGLRLLTSLAIPGWASTMSAALAIIGLQGCLSITSLIFILLSTRSQQPAVPIRLYADAILSVERIPRSAP